MLNMLLFKSIWSLDLFHVLVSEHIKLNHHQCYSSLVLLFLGYLFSFGIQLVLERYKFHKHWKRFRYVVLDYCEQTFNAHYKHVMSSNSTKRHSSVRQKHNVGSSRRYYVSPGRIGNKRRQGFVPYLLIAATYCRALPMYDESNEVDNLRCNTVNMNDDHGFNIDEI